MSTNTNPGSGRWNVLEYVEQGLGLRLHPVQSLILKLLYGLPLSDDEPIIRFRSPYNEVERAFTEREYVRYLSAEGRCNARDEDFTDGRLLGKSALTAVLGRRAGKSTLSSIMSGYAAYELLSLGDPQRAFNLAEHSSIQVLAVSLDKEQASQLHEAAQSHVAQCLYFAPYVEGNTVAQIKFRTPNVVANPAASFRKPTISMSFRTCHAKALRGATNFMVLLDEISHYYDDQSGDNLDKIVYDAVSPSTACFHGDGDLPLARIVMLSSPNGTKGKLYANFTHTIYRAPGYNEQGLALQIPTWEINPHVPMGYYKARMQTDPSTFMIEHGAQFA